MSKVVFVFCFFINCVNVFAQQKILGITKYLQPTYTNAFTDIKQIQISTPYALVNFDSSFVTLDFNAIEVMAWDLVYTQHPKTVNHDKLNERRLIWLQKNIPILFSSSTIKKRIIEQTAAQTKEDAAKLYHGFVVYYREKGMKNQVAKDIEIIKAKLAGTFKPTTTKATSTGKPVKPNAGLSYAYTCYTPDMLAWYKGAYPDAVVYSKKTMVEKKLLSTTAVVPNCDSFVVTFFAKPTIVENQDVHTDSTVTNALLRNKWKAGVYCMDVTASMAPYSAQMLLWLKQKSKKTEVRRFYFFNDGDNKPDYQKPIGHTEGIHQCLSDKIEPVSRTMFRAMELGNGGDLPENNIECLVRAQTDNINAAEIILVADNWAPVRDIKLLPFIKIPVRVILCGNKGNVLADYLNIAYATKGSLHTQYEDLKDISKLKDGDIFTYANSSFQLVKGKFVKL